MTEYERMKLHRKKLKEVLVNAFGGECGICGYDKCNRALEFHHVEKEKKDFTIGTKIRAWSKIVEEARKCIMICSNCHREIHDGLITPENIKTFDEAYSDSVVIYGDKSPQLDKCPICDKMKPIFKATCSRSCAGKKSRKVDWDNIDLIKWIEVDKLTLTTIGKRLNISGNAVKKRYNKVKTLA